MSLRVFLSYRREDGASWATTIRSELERRVSGLKVIKDVRDIRPGANFVDEIERYIRGSDAMLVLIGPQWKPQRLASERDFVKYELLCAHNRHIPIIPVLVDGADVPTTDELPDPLHWLSMTHAAEVRPDPDFDRDMDRLIQLCIPFIETARTEADSTTYSARHIEEATDLATHVRAESVRDLHATEVMHHTPPPTARAAANSSTFDWRVVGGGALGLIAGLLVLWLVYGSR